MGNSLGRAPFRGSDTSATTGWTDGKPWEIAWGEFCWEGSDASETTGWTDEKPREIAWGEFCWEGADGKPWGNSLGRAPFGGSETEVYIVDGWESVGNSLGRGALGGSDILRSRAVGIGFQDKIPSMRLSRKRVHPRPFKWFANVRQWDMHSFVGRERH